jgi:hypothetical protein
LSLADIEGWEKLRKQIIENLPDFNFSISRDTRLQAETINIEESLKNLKVIKGEEYDRPWRDDPTKTNKAFRL